ncbi:uncharacterized protein LOC105844333 isoform X2 [Hydra vulgaris]|uniref:uncharacterized protein LOC105844333 isoform X2 n=1 Tax=Hydra vulgaris TaxID=6087 RepID=UPI001F5F940D|nr:uncharacterized protein LOC105844333 isoform X2 [Hydra vulgaris]
MLYLGKKMKSEGIVTKDSHIWKEGFMEKKTGIIKMWKSRYFVLLDDVLCYFLREEQKESLRPTGRIFFSDTTYIDRTEKKSHPYAILIQTQSKKHLISCASYREREDWVNKIWEAREKHKMLEHDDPIRRKSTRLGKDFKRVTIQKDPQHGIGCTIKNVGGAIFVSRIIPDGPVATSGVLRPGDQIMDINGTQVSQCPIEKIKEIIRSSPEYVVCTVKPVTHYTSHDDSPRQVRQPYTEVDPNLLRETGSTQNKTFQVGSAVSESVEELRALSSPSSPSIDQKLDQHDKLGKKLTNYAQLEFSTHS